VPVTSPACDPTCRPLRGDLYPLGIDGVASVRAGVKSESSQLDARPLMGYTGQNQRREQGGVAYPDSELTSGLPARTDGRRSKSSG